MNPALRHTATNLIDSRDIITCRTARRTNQVTTHIEVQPSDLLSSRDALVHKTQLAPLRTGSRPPPTSSPDRARPLHTTAWQKPVSAPAIRPARSRHRLN